MALASCFTNAWPNVKTDDLAVQNLQSIVDLHVNQCASTFPLAFSVQLPIFRYSNPRFYRTNM